MDGKEWLISDGSHPALAAFRALSPCGRIRHLPTFPDRFLLIGKTSVNRWADGFTRLAARRPEDRRTPNRSPLWSGSDETRRATRRRCATRERLAAEKRAKCGLENAGDEGTTLRFVGRSLGWSHSLDHLARGRIPSRLRKNSVREASNREHQREKRWRRAAA